MKLIPHSAILACVFALTACQQSKELIPTAHQTTNTTRETPKILPINAFAQTQLEWATTEAQKEYGLMNRPHLAVNSGMVFTFGQPNKPCFWMKNTLIPLSIGFIDAQGILVQIENMQPQTLTTHCARTPVQYAVEMNQGWFTQNNVAIGTPLFKIENHQ